MSRDWLRYSLPASDGLSAGGGIDESAYQTLSRRLLEPQRSGSCSAGPLLLTGPAGSGKAHLVRRLPAECPKSLVLCVPCLHLLAVGDEAEGAAVRSLFRHAASTKEACLLVLEGLHWLLEEEEEEAATVKELLACLSAFGRRAGLSLVVSTRSPWLLAGSSAFASAVCLSRPDAARRRQILAKAATSPHLSASMPREQQLRRRLLDRAAEAVEFGVSPADLVSLLHSAAGQPFKRLTVGADANEFDARLNEGDIEAALRETRPTVAGEEWLRYEQWAEQHK